MLLIAIDAILFTRVGGRFAGIAFTEATLANP